MNITEANDTQRLLRWVFELTAFDHRSPKRPDGRSTVTDGEFVDTVRTLADRSNKALGAGVGPDAAEALARFVLGVPTAVDPDAYRDDIDVEDAVQAVEVSP